MRKRFLALFFVLTLWLPAACEAQRVYRIGVLIAGDAFVPAFEGFKEKMDKLGYKEDSGVQYSIYNAKGSPSALQSQARKLLQENPDLIVTSSTQATLPLAKLTRGSGLPVVFLSAGNPLELVKGYASSGNNLTGISTALLDLTAKRLELLKELAPQVARVALMRDPDRPDDKAYLSAVQQAAKGLGLTIFNVNVASREELLERRAKITRKAVDAVFLIPHSVILENGKILIEHTLREKLPLIATPGFYFESGGLATYGHDYFALGQQGAVLVDKILKGARPTDLPIEQPSKLKLAINLKTAKAIGLKISKEILLRADEVIE